MLLIGSMIQTNPKSESPNPREAPITNDKRARAHWKFGAWNFLAVWLLVLGCRSLGDLRYRNLLPTRFRSRALRQTQSQHAVFELGFGFRFIHFGRQRDHALERAITALHPVLPFLVLFALVFLFAADGQRPLFHANISGEKKYEREENEKGQYRME